MSAFSYGLSLTGDCSNSSSGSFLLTLSGGSPPYTVNFLGALSGQTVINTTAPILVSSLNAGTYSARINDSAVPINSEYYVNIPISSGFCGNILNIMDTTCGLNNGSVLAKTTSTNSSIYSYLYTNDDNLVFSKGSSFDNVNYFNLSANTYYLLFEDFGGCTAKTESFIIESSSDFDFGYYAVKNSPCFSGSTGKIYITGETGFAPYTYNWSVPQSGNTITGLTSGLYSVEVIDSKNCSKSKTIEIFNETNLGILSIVSTAPVCFNANGSIIVTISGGTAPYYYMLNDSYVDITYDKTITINNLSAGGYRLSITDAGLCNVTTTTTLASLNSMVSVDINANNSYCSNTNGSISVVVSGGSIPYTFNLVNSSGATNTFVSNANSHNFNNLGSGVYTVYVSDSSGCSYSEELTILTENSYTLNYSTSGSTCDNSNGSVSLFVTSGGTPPYDYYLGLDYSIIDTFLTGVTFNNIPSGQYTGKVIDSLGCEQNRQISITRTSGVDFYLYPISCSDGLNNGVINTFITQGKPPFTFTWSNNVPNNPQNIIISGLTGGTYTLTLVDDNDCSLTRSIDVSCYKTITSTQTYTIDTEDFIVQPIGNQKLLDILNEGFNDLTLGNTSCNLSSAVYEIIVDLQPMGYSNSLIFYTGYTRTIAPLDSDYTNAIKQVVNGAPGVEDVLFDLSSNRIKIIAEPNNQTILSQVLTIRLKITYDIICTS